MSKPVLKPCPFCGAKAEIEDGRNGRPWVVECPNRDCPAQPFMDHADSRLEAIAAWNKRTADQHIERLTSALEAMESVIPLFAKHCGGSDMPLLDGLKVIAAREQARTAIAKARGAA